MITKNNPYKCKKIIDTHVHIGGGNLGFDMTEDMVETLMNRYDIDHILLSNCDCCEVDFNQKLIPEKNQISQIDGLIRTLNFARKHEGRVSVAPFIKANVEGYSKEYADLIKANLPDSVHISLSLLAFLAILKNLKQKSHLWIREFCLIGNWHQNSICQ